MRPRFETSLGLFNLDWYGIDSSRRVGVVVKNLCDEISLVLPWCQWNVVGWQRDWNCAPLHCPRDVCPGEFLGMTGYFSDRA
jgi:hypothetical protein